MLSERLKKDKSLSRKLKRRLLSLRNKKDISLKQSERQANLTLIVRLGLRLKPRKILRDIKNNSEKKKLLDVRELKKSKKTSSGNKNKLTKHSLTNNNKIVRIERDSTNSTKKK